MDSRTESSRRRFVKKLMLGAALAPLTARHLTSARAADQPLLSPEDPAARKVKYTEDASQEKASNGNKCATCSLYEGTYASTRGPCQIFPDKQVKAAGWCTSWAPQL
jgi:High potential iron-sulfur protein